MEKHRKQRKFNLLKFIIAIMFLYIIGFAIYSLAMFPIKNIRVFGATSINDQEALRLAKVDNYPSFFLTTSYSIKKRLKTNEYIKNVTVKKSWFGVLDIYIEEYKILFFNSNNSKLVLETGDEIAADGSVDAPILTNYVSPDIYIDLVNQMAKVDKNILLKISEIEYRPNDIDKERFLLTMNDGNYIYLTLYTFLKVNKYDKILESLEKKNGVLYLDSGNYFDIFN